MGILTGWSIEHRWVSPYHHTDLVTTQTEIDCPGYDAVCFYTDNDLLTTLAVNTAIYHMTQLRLRLG